MVVCLNANAAPEIKYVFPEDVTIVQGPKLPAGYLKWPHSRHECQTSDGRILDNLFFLKSSLKNGISHSVFVSTRALDGKTFVYYYVDDEDGWQGALYMYVNGQWGELKIIDIKTYLRASDLWHEILSGYGIIEKDLGPWVKK